MAYRILPVLISGVARIWRKGGTGAWGTEVPQRGPGAEPWWGVRGEAPPPESSQHITDILLPNYAQFCVFS